MPITLAAGLPLRLLCALLLLSVAPTALADITYPPRPGDREFISDQAGLITPADQATIKAAADSLLTIGGIPIVVVTIESLDRYGAQGVPIERYASSLFDAWGIGRDDRNYGILLLVSKGDRKARIELGRGYTRERDQRTAWIMSNVIIPRFKRGDFSGGIREGVSALDMMARTQRLDAAAGGAGAATPARSTPPPDAVPPAPPLRQSPPQPGGFFGPIVCVGIAVLGFFLLIALARRGRQAALGGAGTYQGVGGYTSTGRQDWGAGSLPFWWYLLNSGGSSGGSRAADHPSQAGSSWGGSEWSAGGSAPSGGFDFGSFGGGSSGGGGSTGSW